MMEIMAIESLLLDIILILVITLLHAGPRRKMLFLDIGVVSKYQSMALTTS